MRRFAVLFLFAVVSVTWAREASPGCMKPYSDKGKYVLGKNEATLSIFRNERGKTDCTVSIPTQDGSLQGAPGRGDFIKNEAKFIIFPQDPRCFWLFDGASTVLCMTFWEEGRKRGIKTESFTAHSRDCLSASMAAMPESFLSLLPTDVRESILKAQRT